MNLTCRRLLRLTGLAGITLVAFADYLLRVAGRRSERVVRQAAWSHRHGRRFARVLGLQIRVLGRWHTTPLVVSNHLSYLDIVTLVAVSPVRFVAKSEVRSWPWFGWLARCGGTLFIDRRHHRSLLAANNQMRRAGAPLVPWVIFPEGTSTNGTTVLPFHGALLAVAAEECWPVLPVWLGYELPGGDAAHKVCWWGNMTLVPHLWRLLGNSKIMATVSLGRPLVHWDRRELAAQLHEAVCGLAPRRQWRAADLVSLPLSL